MVGHNINMKKENKLLCFEYFLSLLFTKCPENQISKLKAMKLLFFTVVALKEENNWKLLDEVFPNFYAMPYGPVESDIYNEMQNMRFFSIEESKCICPKNITPNFELIETDKKIIEESVESLYENHRALFTMSAFDLVELSHRSDCWKIAYNQAREAGLYSIAIPIGMIKKSKIFFQ